MLDGYKLNFGHLTGKARSVEGYQENFMSVDVVRESDGEIMASKKQTVIGDPDNAWSVLPGMISIMREEHPEYWRDPEPTEEEILKMMKKMEEEAKNAANN